VQAKNVDALAAFVSQHRRDYAQPGAAPCDLPARHSGARRKRAGPARGRVERAPAHTRLPACPLLRRRGPPSSRPRVVHTVSHRMGTRTPPSADPTAPNSGKLQPCLDRAHALRLSAQAQRRRRGQLAELRRANAAYVRRAQAAAVRRSATGLRSRSARTCAPAPSTYHAWSRARRPSRRRTRTSSHTGMARCEARGAGRRGARLRPRGQRHTAGCVPCTPAGTMWGHPGGSGALGRASASKQQPSPCHKGLLPGMLRTTAGGLSGAPRRRALRLAPAHLLHAHACACPEQ